MNAAEITMRRRQTKAFIDHDPSEVVFKRLVVARDNMGGRTGTAAAADPPPQRVRVIPARTRSTALTYTLPNGVVVEAKDKLLVGMPELDVQEKDQFQWPDGISGMWYQVDFVDTDRRFETLCQLDLVGESPRQTT